MSCTVKMLMEMGYSRSKYSSESADPASDSNQSNSGLSGTIDELQVPGTLVAISRPTLKLSKSVTVLDTNVYINSNYFEFLCSESTYAQNWTFAIHHGCAQSLMVNRGSDHLQFQSIEMTLRGDWVELYNNLGCDKTDWELLLGRYYNTSCASLAAETLLFNVYRIDDNNLYWRWHTTLSTFPGYECGLQNSNRLNPQNLLIQLNFQQRSVEK